MNENDILLDNVSCEVIDYIRQLNFKKASFGGYDKNYVLLNIQEICNIYERYIKKIFADNKSHVDMLNNEIYDLRQKNESLMRRSTDPTVAEQANRAIAEANARISEANARIAKLQALYDEAQAKLRSRDDERQVVDIISDARLAAAEIIKRASEEAELIRYRARSEADSLAREKREEIKAEERAHEERIFELKEKYAKCRKHLAYMLDDIKELETNIECMVKRQEDLNPDGVFSNVYSFSQRQSDKNDNFDQNRCPGNK